MGGCRAAPGELQSQQRMIISDTKATGVHVIRPGESPGHIKLRGSKSSKLISAIQVPTPEGYVVGLVLLNNRHTTRSVSSFMNGINLRAHRVSADDALATTTAAVACGCVHEIMPSTSITATLIFS